LINDILKKHGAEEEGELGQSQFAELLQPILQEVADALAKKHFAVIHNIKIVNGSELKKVGRYQHLIIKLIIPNWWYLCTSVYCSFQREIKEHFTL
jgi:hypothetical protein